MNTDVALVTGLFLAILAVPSIVSAFSESRAPITGTIILMVGGGLMAWAISLSPDVFSLAEIPHAIVRVAAIILN